VFRRHLRHSRLPCRLAAVLAWGWSGRAHACAIDVVGPDSARWQGAAAATTSALSADAQLRCASVIIETVVGGAVLRLATRDGRLAVRELRSPVELLPAVQALTVRVPDSPPSGEGELQLSEERPDPAPEAPLVSAARPSKKAQPREPERPALRDPYVTRPIIGAALGFRIGADRLITPTVGGSVSVLQAPLELGILMRYEAHYVASTGGNDDRPETSGLAFGTQLGIYRPLERLAFRSGLLLLVVALHEDKGAQNGRAEARFGGYFGVVWPSRSKLRLRCDIALDLVPYNIGSSETNALHESSLPWWGFGWALGLELG
jgi:hypothetical protein